MSTDSAPRHTAFQDQQRIPQDRLLGAVLKGYLPNNFPRKKLAESLRTVTRDWLAEASSGVNPLSESFLETLVGYDGFTPNQKTNLRYGNILLQALKGKTPQPNDQSKLNLLGFVGATNHDFIVGQSAYIDRGLKLPLSGEYPEVIAESYDQLKQEFENTMKVFPDGSRPYKYEHGGSSFNVAYTAAATRMGFSVAFVGVAGAAHEELLHEPFQSHATLAKFELGMDITFLPVRQAYGGHCLAVCAEHDNRLQRQMSTLPPEHNDLYAHLVHNFWEIVEYLARGKMLHVSSLFDAETPDVLATLVEEVVRMNPAICLSFDPGDLWSKSYANAPAIRNSIRRILRQTNILFASSAEVENLANSYVQHMSGDRPAEYARRVHRLLDASLSTVVVVKREGVAEMYRRDRREDRVALTPLLKDSEIEDDTGAGDAFAGGFLSGRMSGLNDSDSARLGLALARKKLTTLGHPLRGAIQQEARLFRAALAARQESSQTLEV